MTLDDLEYSALVIRMTFNVGDLYLNTKTLELMQLIHLIYKHTKL